MVLAQHTPTNEPFKHIQASVPFFQAHSGRVGPFEHIGFTDRLDTFSLFCCVRSFRPLGFNVHVTRNVCLTPFDQPFGRLECKCDKFPLLCRILFKGFAVEYQHMLDLAVNLKLAYECIKPIHTSG